MATETATATLHRTSFALPIRTEAALKEFLFESFQVRFPDTVMVPGHSTPWRAFCDAYFARSPVVIVKASRAFGGKSYLAAYLGLTMAATLKCDVNILGGSGEQAKRVHGHMAKAWDVPSAPKRLLRSDPTARETRLAWGNTVQALMASQASVRGPHPQRLIIDEADETSLDLIDAAFGQPMERDGVKAGTVILSTHHQPDGTMTELLKRAGKRGWPVHDYSYRETMQPHGWLSSAQVEQKRNELTDLMWRVEIENQEPSPEGRALLPEAVEMAFAGPEIEETPGREQVFEAPEPGATYATGGDWARSVNSTVIPTLRTDCTPYRVVAFERCQRLPWPVMVAKFDARLLAYPGAGLHDGTGIGDVVSGFLTQPAEGMILAGRARTDLIAEYLAALEHGEIVGPRIPSLYTEHRYASTDQVYGSGHLPDTICAMALAYRAAKSVRRPGDHGLTLGRVAPTASRPPMTELHNGVAIDDHAATGCPRCQARVAVMQ